MFFKHFHVCFRVMYCDVVIFQNIFRTFVQKNYIFTWCCKFRKLIVTKGTIFNDLLKLINRSLFFLTHMARIMIILCGFFRSPFFLLFWCKATFMRAIVSRYGVNMLLCAKHLVKSLISRANCQNIQPSYIAHTVCVV